MGFILQEGRFQLILPNFLCIKQVAAERAEFLHQVQIIFVLEIKYLPELHDVAWRKLLPAVPTHDCSPLTALPSSGVARLSPIRCHVRHPQVVADLMPVCVNGEIHIKLGTRTNF